MLFLGFQFPSAIRADDLEKSPEEPAAKSKIERPWNVYLGAGDPIAFLTVGTIYHPIEDLDLDAGVGTFVPLSDFTLGFSGRYRLTNGDLYPSVGFFQSFIFEHPTEGSSLAGSSPAFSSNTGLQLALDYAFYSELRILGGLDLRLLRYGPGSRDGLQFGFTPFIKLVMGL